MIGDEYQKYDFLTNMNILMSETPDDVDKRQAGLFYDIYTAVAQFGAMIFAYLKGIALNMHPSTAQGYYLDLHGEDVGITRLEATHAVKRVYVYNNDGELFDIPIGTMVTPKGNGNLLYTLIEKEAVGTYKARCQETGKIGNEYIGECDLLDNVQNVGSIMMADIIESARDEETDSELRDRIQDAAIAKGFGGNIAQYRQLAGEELPMVKQMQVYPRDFNDPILNSTVISVVDNDNLPIAQEQLNQISELVDPSSFPGQGRGLAPIGHHPVFTTPEQVSINMSMTIVPDVGYSAEGLTDRINEEIENYLSSVRDNWANINYLTANLYSVSIFHSQVIALLQDVEGILAVNNLIINGVDANTGRVDLVETKEKQQLPILGTIIVS